MGKNSAILGIGSNINPLENIAKAKALVSKDYPLIQSTTLEETTPVGPIQDQPNFLNGAWLISTELSLNELTTYLKQIEDTLGRDRSQSNNGPRPIDLDVITWNGKIVDDSYYSRDFLKNMVDKLLAFKNFGAIIGAKDTIRETKGVDMT